MAIALTIARLDQPARSRSTIGGVPFCVCLDAQLCRMSCHRNPSSPARFTAFSQAVLTLPIGAIHSLGASLRTHS